MIRDIVSAKRKNIFVAMVSTAATNVNKDPKKVIHVKTIAIIANTQWKEIALTKAGFQSLSDNTEKSLHTRIQSHSWKTKYLSTGQLSLSIMTSLTSPMGLARTEEAETKASSSTN